MKTVHFIGVGGIGMSALAQYYLSQGWVVSGSDLVSTDITKELVRENIKIKIGHRKDNLPRNTNLVVFSQAVKFNNSEFKEARRLKIDAISYPEAVGNLTKKYQTVAIAGAHGKSTTTALVALALTKAGLDPTVIIGTKLKEFGGKNFRRGRSKYLVLEADEFGRAFLHYSPTLAIITNIDREHLDVYKNLAGVQKAFLWFMANAKFGGIIVLNKDSRPLSQLKRQITKIAKQKSLKTIWFSTNSSLAKKIRKSLWLPGEHNLSNALAAYYAGGALKIPGKKILSAISNYRGSWRRMEYRGELRSGNLKLKTKVFDDYAHHPTEIKATLAAFKEKFPESTLICVFQPHQTERLKLLFKEFKTAFDDADVTLILPVYQVAGRDETNREFTSKKLAMAIQKKQPKKLLFYLEKPGNLKKALVALLKPTEPGLSASHSRESAIVVMMGAGDIVNYTDSLLKI